MIYLQLFYAYLKIGFFSFGGGYSMLSLIQNEVVVRQKWIGTAEFADIIAISQMTPGPIAINSATYIGYTVTGNVWGSIIATIAVCLPSLTIMILVTKFYIKLKDNQAIKGAMNGMQPVMLGMIAAAALMLLTPETFIDTKSWAIFGVCFVLSMVKISPILLIASSAVAGIVLYI